MHLNRRDFMKVTSAAAMSAALPLPAMAEVRNGMPYRELGKTGEKVSLLCLGGAHIGTGQTEEEAITIMRTAIDEGVNFFDNAWHYNDGASEVRMGKALKDGYRDKVFLMTKHHGREPKVAQEHLEESLRRMQVEVIDLWQFHEIIRPEEPEEIYTSGVIDFALKAKEEGKIRYIGFTGHHLTTTHLEMIERGFAWDTVQMPINPFDYHYRSYTQRVLPKAVEKGIGVIAMKTNGGGGLANAGVVTPEECLRFAMSQPVAAACSGMDNLEVLKKNLEVARNFKPLEEAELAALLEKTAPLAADGAYEAYKTAWHKDIQEKMREAGQEVA